MAIANSDGSIILSTKVDTSEVDKLGKVYEKSLKKGNTQLATLVENFRKATQEVEAQKKKVEELKKELSELESGKIQVSSPETEKIRKEIESTTQAISEQEKQIEQFYSRLDQLQSGAFIDPRTGNPVLVGADKKEFEQINAELDKLEPSLEANKTKAEQLKNELNSAFGAATQGRIGATKAKLGEAELKLTNLSAKADISGSKLKFAMTKASVGLKSFTKRIAGIIKSALIFSVIYRVMQSVVKLFQNILMSDEEFRQDWEELKAAFYTAAYPIVNLIVPAIKYIVQQVRDWAISIGKVAAALQGMSYSELVDQAKASKEAADNYADMEKSSKNTADNLKKQLAAFDDIQILSSGNEEEQGSGLAGFESLKEYDTSGEKSMLGDLMTAIGGALAAVGIILIFKGQIGWGIGFLVAGAAFWAISEIWGKDYDPNSVADILSNIMETIGISLAAIGIILITKGQFAWGIGFVIAGAIAGLFGVAIATLSDEDVSQKAKDTLSEGMIIVGVVAVVLGILLCMAQQWGWGVGLIAVGVASIVTPLVLNWDGIKEALSNEKTAGWLSVGGIIAIILGIFLCFVQMWALGIGLIAMGAATVATVVVVNWDSITELFTDDKTAKWLAVGGVVAIVIGVLLCFAQLWGWGIGMIALGAATVATVVAVNWNAIVEALQGPIGAITAIVSGALLVLGIILVCTGAGIPLGIGLIVAGAVGLATVVAVNWDSIKEKIEETWNSIKEWISTYGMLVLGIILCLTGAGIPFGIGIIINWAKENAEEVPLAAKITEKVKEVWDAVKSFWNEHIAPIFTKEWWENLAKNCANGLIGIFEDAVNGIIGLFESLANFIVDALTMPLNLLGDFTTKLFGLIGIDLEIPEVGDIDFGEVEIPRLAKGAVIPPNREFLAVLGDQKRGTNIEAPLDTIVNAMNIALSQNGNTNSQPIKEEHYYLNETELMRIIYKLSKGGERLGGDNLISEGIY